MQRTTTSPSSSTTRRSTPWVAGCCGPMLSSMCSLPGSTATWPATSPPPVPPTVSGTRTGRPRASSPGVASSSSTVRLLIRRTGACGAGPEPDHRVHGELLLFGQVDLHAQVDASLERPHKVHELDRPLGVPVLDGRHVHQVVVAVASGVAQPAHHLAQRIAADGHDRLAVARHDRAADRVAEGRSQGVDGGVHADRNWCTELPKGSEISSIRSGGRRSPSSSRGCSWRSSGSSIVSPLIFLCSSSTQYSSPSGRGGHPGTYTSTGTIVSMPCTMA